MLIKLHNVKNGKNRTFRHEEKAELFLDNTINPQNWKRIGTELIEDD